MGKNSENVRQNRNYNDENKVFVSCMFLVFLFYLALSWNITDDMLRDAFSQCGKIEHYKVKSRFSSLYSGSDRSPDGSKPWNGNREVQHERGDEQCDFYNEWLCKK